MFISTILISTIPKHTYFQKERDPTYGSLRQRPTSTRARTKTFCDDVAEVAPTGQNLRAVVTYSLEQRSTGAIVNYNGNKK